MRIFSAEYLASLAAVALVCVGAVAAARLRPGPWTIVFARGLALVLLANFLSWYVVERAHLNLRGLYWELPLGLCEVATFVGAAALWWRRPLLVELTYFWGLAGTMQALLTPNLDSSSLFPSYFYFQFYINHGGIVLAALFLVAGLGLVPKRGAVVRVLAVTIPYVLVVGGIDRLTGGNYLFFAHRPATWSLLNLMGPWPWYIAGMTVLGVVVLVILDLPLRAARSRHVPRLMSQRQPNS